jgi:hypothetical protein
MTHSDYIYEHASGAQDGTIRHIDAWLAHFKSMIESQREIAHRTGQELGPRFAALTQFTDAYDSFLKDLDVASRKGLPLPESPSLPDFVSAAKSS